MAKNKKIHSGDLANFDNFEYSANKTKNKSTAKDFLNKKIENYRNSQIFIKDKSNLLLPKNNKISEIFYSEKDLILKKHAYTIHCKNIMSLMQRKIANVLLMHAYPNLKHNNRFSISSRKLCNLIGYNSNDYSLLKKAIIDLISITIEWNVIDSSTGKEKNWKASSALSAAEIADGNCSYEYSSIMRELLYQPEVYGKIDMQLISRFKSSYGLALYENCVRYLNLSKTPWFSLDIFKKLMGVSKDKYKEFKYLKKRVINIAVKEVNLITSMKLVVEVKTVKRKVTEIRFKFIENSIKVIKDNNQ